MAGLEFWRVGHTSPRTIGLDASELERTGWDGIMIGDSQCVVGDCYVALAIAAQATSTIGIGVGVTNPITRHPAATAAAIGAIHELSGGRAVLGLGRGDSSLAHIGLAPASPAVFEQYLRNVQTYLRGNGVAFDDLDRGSHRRSTELGGAGAPEDSRLRWLDPSVTKVPVDVAASGPAIIATAATLGDRITFGVGAEHERLAWAIDTARRARTEADLDPDAVEFGAYLNVVAHPDEEVALRLAGSGVAMFSRFSAMHGKATGPVTAASRATLQRVAADYDLRQHGSSNAEHRRAVDADHVTSFGVVGTPAQCVERLVALSELGLRRVTILGGIAGTSEQEQQDLRDSRQVLAREVFPAVRARLATAAATSRAPR